MVQAGDDRGAPGRAAQMRVLLLLLLRADQAVRGGEVVQGLVGHRGAEPTHGQRGQRVGQARAHGQAALGLALHLHLHLSLPLALHEGVARAHTHAHAQGQAREQGRRRVPQTLLVLLLHEAALHRDTTRHQTSDMRHVHGAGRQSCFQTFTLILESAKFLRTSYFTFFVHTLLVRAATNLCTRNLRCSALYAPT